MASPTSNPTTAPNPSTTEPPPLTDDAELDPEIDMAIDPAPPEPENPVLEEALPEPREATRKDISLRDFLGKMDDYAPIVCSNPPTCVFSATCILYHYSPRYFTDVVVLCLDTRRGNAPPPPPRRAPPNLDPPPPLAAPRPRDAEVHRRHSSRRVSVLTHAILRHGRWTIYHRGCDTRS